MKMHSRLITAFAITALASVVPLRAQEGHLIAHVPFAFTVGGANFPVDTYRLSQMDGHPDMVFLRGDRTGTFLQADVVRLTRDGAPPSLVFHRYGDQYFLREIRWDGATRFDLPETKAERSAAQDHKDRAAALKQTVTITAGR